MPVVDTLKLKTRLSESGMPEPQAQVLVEELDDVLSTAIARETASKADVVELRAAIHGLEERFDQRLEQVDRRLDELKADNVSMRAEIGGIRAEIGGMRADNVSMRAEIGGIRAEIGGMKADNVSMRAEVDNVKTEIGSMKTEISNIKGELRLLRWMGGILVAIQLGIWLRLLFM